MIEESVKKLLSEVPAKNPFGEPVIVVAAVKTQQVAAINEAIAAGITDIGDNHVQEFRNKYAEIEGAPRRHFIGHLQTNKIKYLLGRCDLYQSVDRLSLAGELSKKSAVAGVTSNVLLQINAGNEETKGGFSFEEIDGAYDAVKAMPALNIQGLMAMLPFTDDQALLKKLATEMRRIFDRLKARDHEIKYLSMGMSGDWKLCVECGSNMIRVGTTIFGQRVAAPRHINSKNT